jgi:SAM-dependent methyltransferase
VRTDPASGPVSCPGCLSERGRPAFTINGHRVRRCRGCRTLFVERPPAEEKTAHLYEGEGYFVNPGFERGFVGYRDYLAERALNEEKFDGIIGVVERFRPPGSLLDVGAGPGLLVKVAERRGWRAKGLDLNPWAVRVAREEMGADVESGGLAAGRFGEDEFDAVTMLDLIEHLPGPEELIAEAARVTGPGGVLAILSPDAGSLTTRALGRRWPEIRRVPEHLVIFSVSGLADLVERHGFEPLGWHSTGKKAELAGLAADMSEIAPPLGRAAHRALERTRLGRRVFEFDPRVKFCFYARRRPDVAPSDLSRDESAWMRRKVPRLPKPRP